MDRQRQNEMVEYKLVRNKLEDPVRQLLDQLISHQALLKSSQMRELS